MQRIAAYLRARYRRSIHLMRPRMDVARLLLCSVVTWTGLRLTAVALPLVALAQTGSAWSTGVVGGMAGVPAFTAAWWARRLRQRIVSGRALAGVLVLQATGVLIVPVAVQVAHLQVWHLCVSGLVVGAATALGEPAQQAMLADLGDRLGAGAANRAVAGQDLVRRTTMVFGPPLAAWMVADEGAIPLLWFEAVALAAGAILVSGLPRCGPRISWARQDTAPGIWQVLSDCPDIMRGLVMRGTGSLVWFAFSLGLAVMGAQTGQPGVLIAAGMSGYGAGSLAGAALAVALVARMPALPTAAISWVGLGASFVVVAIVPDTVVAIAVTAAVGGVLMPFGITAINTLITRTTAGGERLAAFAGQTIVMETAAATGLLLGGWVLDRIGATHTLVACGVLQIIVILTVMATRSQAVDGFWPRLWRSPANAASAAGKQE